MERDHSTLLETSLDSLHLELLQLFASQAAALQTPLYLVGGVVRDLLLGRVIQDFDLVVEGDVADFAESILKKYGGKILVHSTAKGGVATAWALSDMKARGTAPLGLVFQRTNPIMVQGAVLAGLALLDGLTPDPLTIIETGDYLRLNPPLGIVEVMKRPWP